MVRIARGRSRLLGAMVLAGGVGAALAVAVAFAGDDGASGELAPGTTPAAAITDLPAATGAAPGRATDHTGNGAGAPPSAHRPDPPPRDPDAERRPLRVGRGAKPSMDDKDAREVYCSIDPADYLQMVYDRDTGEVDQDLLRDMMVIGDELYQHWQFAAYGRPGFESMLTLVYDTNRHWQLALDELDTGNAGRSAEALANAGVAMNKLEAAQKRADVTCS